MIYADDFDVDVAQEWAIRNAIQQGCTCTEEPKVYMQNCETHGVHLAHLHHKGCLLHFFFRPDRHELIASAEWN